MSKAGWRCTNWGGRTSRYYYKNKIKVTVTKERIINYGPKGPQDDGSVAKTTLK